LGGTFDLREFEHVAEYDAERGVVESFLVAQRAQVVEIEGLGLTVPFADGERIHTESSYKFSEDDVATVAAEAGFAVARRWTDERERFAVSLLVAR
jgi:uncharacterized SAM-dependent methyltransferase